MVRSFRALDTAKRDLQPLILAVLAGGCVLAGAADKAAPAARQTPAPRSARVPVPGARLYAREVGRGRPIVVLHGGPDFDHSYLLPDMDPACPCSRPVGYVPKDNDLRTHYLELPVLAAVSSGRAGLRPYGVFGPVFSYLVAARNTRDGLETNLEGSLRVWDVAVTAGGGLERSGDHTWFVEARWTFGLASVNDSSLLNQVGQLLVGMTFRRSR